MTGRFAFSYDVAGVLADAAAVPTTTCRILAPYREAQVKVQQVQSRSSSSSRLPEA